MQALVRLLHSRNTNSLGTGPLPCLRPHLDVLAILLLRLIFALLVQEPLLLALDEGLKVSPVTI